MSDAKNPQSKPGKIKLKEPPSLLKEPPPLVKPLPPKPKGKRK